MLLVDLALLSSSLSGISTLPPMTRLRLPRGDAKKRRPGDEVADLSWPLSLLLEAALTASSSASIITVALALRLRLADGGEDGVAVTGDLTVTVKLRRGALGAGMGAGMGMPPAASSWTHLGQKSLPVVRSPRRRRERVLVCTVPAPPVKIDAVIAGQLVVLSRAADVALYEQRVVRVDMMSNF